MKGNGINIRIKHVVAGIVLGSSLYLLSSCAVKENFQVSSLQPAARGNVKITKDNNNNYVIRVNVSNLAELERLQADKDSYVVWLKTSDGNTKNLGQLNVSKSLDASLTTISPYEPDQIFITAENDNEVQYPGSMVILATPDL